MKALVLGSTGYAGMLLLRLLCRHPEVESVIASSRSQAGRGVRDMDPGLSPEDATRVEGGILIAPEDASKRPVDVVFAALPHLDSSRVLAPYFGRSVVVDLAADFRIQDVSLFASAYGSSPPRADLLPTAAYGLSELYTQEVKTTDLIANPGCYPTAALLPLLPLLREGLVTGPVVLNALSGITGAGKKPRANYLFSERAENVNAYAPGTSHRHWAEIFEQAKIHGLGSRVESADGRPSGATLFFTPHLVPIRKGIAVTGTAPLAGGAKDAQSIAACLESTYKQRPFIGLSKDRIPETRDVRDTNRCDIGWNVENGYLFFFSVIDNLMKGASGQAIQNMNIRFGLPETAGLPLTGSS